MAGALATLTAEELLELPDFTPNIYKVVRALRKDDHGAYNCLASVVFDTEFVNRVVKEYDFPRFANLRCGLWYAGKHHGRTTAGDDDEGDMSGPGSCDEGDHDDNDDDLRCPIDGTCYFKSTDGHNNNWSFSATRLNVHVAECAARAGGCVIVDATRSTTKRFPDSFSKTIPIWAEVVNRVVCAGGASSASDGEIQKNETENDKTNEKNDPACDWRAGPFLPPWVSVNEKESIHRLLPLFCAQLVTVNPDLKAVVHALKAPLRCFWVNADTLAKGALPFSRDGLTPQQRGFTPIILVSASSPMQWHGERRVTQDGGNSFAYVPGAGDDEESWARGVSPGVFWRLRGEIMRASSGINKALDAIAERECLKGNMGRLTDGSTRTVRLTEGSKQTETVGQRKTSSNTGTQKVWEVAGTSDARRGAAGCLSPARRLLIAAQSGSPLGAVSEGAVRVLGRDPRLSGIAVGSVGSLCIESVWENARAVLYVGESDNPFSFGAQKNLAVPALHVKARPWKRSRDDLAVGLPAALGFIHENRTDTNENEKDLLNDTDEKNLLIVCDTGADHCVGVVVAWLLATQKRVYEKSQKETRGLSFKESITKDSVRRALAVVSAQHPEASPSRGTLKQVFNYLR
jgi:tRNA A64-2'-O-ribosylphosphate transferase